MCASFTHPLPVRKPHRLVLVWETMFLYASTPLSLFAYGRNFTAFYWTLSFSHEKSELEFGEVGWLVYICQQTCADPGPVYLNYPEVVEPWFRVEVGRSNLLVGEKRCLVWTPRSKDQPFKKRFIQVNTLIIKGRADGKGPAFIIRLIQDTNLLLFLVKVELRKLFWMVGL